MARTTIKSAEKYVKLHEQKEKLESDLKKVKGEIAKMEEGLLEYFERHSINKLGAGGRTVHLHRQVFASLKDKEAAHAALREHGYSDLVEDRVLPQRLSAWVRELLAEAEANEGELPASSDNLGDALPLPDSIKEQIKVTEKFSVRVRRS
jgi:hypothetical protein